MTPTDFRTARKALGYTQHGMAEALGMGKHGWQSISKWERGARRVPEHFAVTMSLLLEKVKQ